MAVRGTTHILLILQSTNAQRHTHRVMWCSTISLMVMCFMSVPCCGCVSQTERLTNCSILLNVRVMEAINGSELIAITHLAPCYCAFPFTIGPEDLLLSRYLILNRIFGLQTDCILENRITFYHYNFISWQTVGRCLLSQPLPSCSECL